MSTFLNYLFSYEVFRLFIAYDYDTLWELLQKYAAEQKAPQKELIKF
jgi:hypothetical protein